MRYKSAFESNPQRFLPNAALGLAVLVWLLQTPSIPAMAGRWQGKEVTQDGVLHIMNPALPMEEPRTITPEVLWQLEGDEEEFVLGVIMQVATDNVGNIYLLDSQLNDVKVFAPSGEYIRSIGREGEGPGEFRRPSDLFITPSGNVAVMQRMPGKIVLLTPEGEPMGNYPVPEPDDRGMRMFSGGRTAGEHAVLAIQRFMRDERGMDELFSLVGVNEESKETVTYLNHKFSRDFASMMFDEKKSSISSFVWDASSEGPVYISDDFDSYHIQVWKLDGTLDRVIEKEYVSRIRSEEEKELYKPRVRMRRGNHALSPEVRTSKTDRDIIRIFPREDGSFWVLSSRGAFDVPEGTIGIFDIFDRDGKFISQLTIKGRGNYRQDGFYLVKDRLYIVTGLRSARMAMFGLGGGSDDIGEVEDAEPVSLICYGLTPVIQSSN